MKNNKKSSKPIIKPCPFCGSAGVVYHWGMSLYWSAECTGDNLKSGEMCGCRWSNYFKTEELAVEVWNRRVG